MDIKNLPENEKPREKLMMRGAEALSDAELLAVLIGSGTRKLPVMELSEKLIEFDESGILFLAECVPEELCSISGIGKAKACKLVAAIELGKRIAKKPRDGKFTASRPDKAAMYVMEELRYLKREVFLVMMLNTKGEVIAFEKVAEGDINSAAVKAREIFNKAVRKNAFSVILVHNHPSGDPSPSRADIETTERLVEAGSIIGIPVADHLIIGNGSFYSFKENKIM
ncbi:MAG: JAB domain-containing protein [Clostridiales bacterium]|nr:JAB domain-containing protein [Clostridiales bacterium]